VHFVASPLTLRGDAPLVFGQRRNGAGPPPWGGMCVGAGTRGELARLGLHSSGAAHGDGADSRFEGRRVAAGCTAVRPRAGLSEFGAGRGQQGPDSAEAALITSARVRRTRRWVFHSTPTLVGQQAQSPQAHCLVGRPAKCQRGGGGVHQAAAQGDIAPASWPVGMLLACIS